MSPLKQDKCRAFNPLLSVAFMNFLNSSLLKFCFVISITWYTKSNRSLCIKACKHEEPFSSFL